MLVIHSAVHAQQQYEAVVDIENVRNDKLDVTIKLPEVNQRPATFIFPKVVPGTYDRSAFGRFIDDFKVYTDKGKKLKTKRVDENAYLIKKADKAATVSYRVSDTWDSKSGKWIFQPGGSNFEAGQEFVLNNFAICGYLNGYTENYSYQLEVIKPTNLYGATSLDRVEATDSRDVFIAENYVELVDQPILYSVPDTISYYEGGAKIGIAVHSPVEEINAQVIMDMIRPITQATSYVLGQIPTDEYWFLFHFFNWGDEAFTNGEGYYGALEHKKSSLYFVPTYLGADGVDLESVEGTIYDMATHEFLHILAPLNLHSEEIAYFDFYDTELSEHLWLYEGVTEYLSIKSLLVSGLIDMDQFGKEMVGKIRGANRYKDMSFTEMSKRIIEPEIQREYDNVYLKGALLALILDIKTAQVTNGEMDLIDLVLELIEDYGMGKPFKDEDLFDVIASKTSPDLREFFRKYYEGYEDLPLEELLQACGVSFTSEIGEDEFSFRPFNMDLNAQTGLLDLYPGEDNIVLTKPMSISKLNDEEISFRLLRHLLMNPSNGDPVKIEYVEDGVIETILVEPVLEEAKPEYVIEKMAEQDAYQTKLFNKLFTAGDRE